MGISALYVCIVCNLIELELELELELIQTLSRFR